MGTSHIRATTTAGRIAFPGERVGDVVLGEHALVIGDGTDQIVITGPPAYLDRLAAALHQATTILVRNQPKRVYTVTGLVIDGELHIAGIMEGDNLVVDENWESGGHMRYATSLFAASVQEAETLALFEFMVDQIEVEP